MVVNLGERHLAVGIIDHEGNVGVRDRVVTPSKDRLTALTRLVEAGAGRNSGRATSNLARPPDPAPLMKNSAAPDR